MCAGNRPNFNSDSGLTPNGGGAGGVSPGSAPKGNAPRSPRSPKRRPRGPEVRRPTSTSSPRPSAARAAARLTGVRFKVPAETMSAKLANLPEGVSVARGRIEVRFDGAEDALERLFALAQALGNDYVRFEELVGR